MLGDRDRVVCIGGNTPDESYLNAMSVLRVAEHEGVDSLHPGIGFLSENSSFAELMPQPRHQLHRPAGREHGSDGQQIQRHQYGVAPRRARSYRAATEF